MSAPKRIQRHRTKGWRMPESAVYVGRGSKWGNPFRVGERVTFEHTNCDVSIVHSAPVVIITPALAVALFEAWIAERGWLDQIRAKLAGLDLTCWCPLDQPCHADVLLEIANGCAL